MDSAWSPSAFMVLNREVVIGDGTEQSPNAWRRIECASKKAYGCGEVGQKLIDGVTLYVRRLDNRLDLTSSLRIHLSGEVVTRVEAEFGVRGRFRICCRLRLAHQHLIVMELFFIRTDRDVITYYLVYDYLHSSLYLIPYLQRGVGPFCQNTPLPVRTTGGDGFELVIMAEDDVLCDGDDRSFLCVFSPGVSRKTASPWQVKEHRFRRSKWGFTPDVVFSLGGKIFWADLRHGLHSSDLRGGGVVETDYIGFPDEMYEREDDVKVNRTVACVKGSIRFACLQRSSDYCPDYVVLKVWTLDLVQRHWVEDEYSSCLWKELWKGIDFMSLEFRDVDPQYPVLMPDGSLTLLLDNMRMERDIRVEVNYICRFDLRSRSTLWYGRVVNYGTATPVILPYSHFRKWFPSSRGRKRTACQMELPAGKSKLPTTEMFSGRLRAKRRNVCLAAVGCAPRGIK